MVDYTELYTKYPPEKNFELILDSGAFTAWTKKIQINLDDYIEFIKKFEPYVTAYVNLDVIPAEFGRKPTPDEVEQSADQGFKNMLYMREKGLKSIPVFHQDEEFKWLMRMIEEGYDYIGISPANDRTTNQKIEWLNKVFDLITNSKGEPIIKTHGFAVTALKLVKNYPWFSVDSASWVRTSSYGTVYIPDEEKDGTYDFTKPPMRVCVSEKSPTMKLDGKHYITYEETKKKEIDKYLSKVNLSFEQLRNDYKKRDQVNIIYFNELEKALDNSIYKAKVFDLDSSPKYKVPFDLCDISKKAIEEKTKISLWKAKYENKGQQFRTKIYLATAFCDHRNLSLTQAGNKQRLVSYFYFKQGNVSEDYIPKFVKQGYGTEIEKQQKEETTECTVPVEGTDPLVEAITQKGDLIE